LEEVQRPTTAAKAAARRDDGNDRRRGGGSSRAFSPFLLLPYSSSCWYCGRRCHCSIGLLRFAYFVAIKQTNNNAPPWWLLLLAGGWRAMLAWTAG